MNENSTAIDIKLATTTYSTNQEITMNNDIASTCKPVDVRTLTDKISQVAKGMVKQEGRTLNEKRSMLMQQRAMSALHTIITNDERGMYDERPSMWAHEVTIDKHVASECATSTDKLIPAVADVVTRDQAQTSIDELGWRLAKTAQGGRSWAKVARACGYTVTGDETCVTLSVRFTPGDKDAYLRHSDNMRSLIGRCPKVESGSTWGDDGVATMINEERGSIVLNTAGVSKRFVAGLR